MKSEYRIGRIWGIPINIHISLFLLMGYFALRAASAGYHEAGMMGSIVAVLYTLVFLVFLFTSIALHELGHSFVAIRQGFSVREITLMFIGGAAKMEKLPTRPREEFLMAIAGPGVSIVVGSACRLLSTSIPGNVPVLISWLAALLFHTGTVNFILAGFNLLPAFPMDGGRVFRALISPKFGRVTATRYATVLGKLIAVLFVFGGLFGVPGIPWLENGSFFLVLIAGFIYIFGEREYRVVQVEELMKQRGFDRIFQDRQAPHEPPADDHTVLISPPPYQRNGPVLKTEIHREQKTRSFRDLFSR